MLWSVLVSWRKVYGKWLISFECIGCIDLLVLRRNRCVGLWSVTSWRISVAWPLVPESLWCLLSAHRLQDSQASCPWDHTMMSWILQFIPACRLWAEISDFSSSETWTWGSPSVFWIHDKPLTLPADTWDCFSQKFNWAFKAPPEKPFVLSLCWPLETPSSHQSSILIFKHTKRIKDMALLANLGHKVSHESC